MTVLKKCELCRARKIKCDEKQPSCSPCKKSSLDCVYRYRELPSMFVPEELQFLGPDCWKAGPERSNDVDSHDTKAGTSLDRGKSLVFSDSLSLSLREHRTMGDGAGQILTFTIRPSRPQRKKHKGAKCTVESVKTDFSIAIPPLSGPPWSPMFGLGQKWIFNFQQSPCSESRGANVYDIWTRHVPSLIGHANYLDLAITHFIDCMRLFIDHNEINEKTAFESGAKALKSLRRTVDDDAVEADPAHILLAIMLHRYAESFKALNTDNYVPHIQAMGLILKRQPAELAQNEIVESIRYNIFEDGVFEALLRCTDSCFDISQLPSLPAQTGNHINDALLALQDLYICVPRLARRVRTAREASGNEDATKQARILAQMLYTSTNNDFIKLVLAEEMAPKDTTFESMPHVERVQSFEFRTGAAFVLAAKYYTYRVLLCGLILALCALEQSQSPFYENEVQREDISAATAVAMCIEYALKPPTGHTLMAMRLFLPVQMAFGSWDRLEKTQSRQNLFASPEYKKAVYMKHWCVGISRKIDHMWGNLPTDYHQLEELCELFAGGPAAPNVSSWAPHRK